MPSQTTTVPQEAEQTGQGGRLLLLGVMLAAAIGGNTGGAAGAVPPMEPALRHLMLLMAGLKIMTALIAYLLTDWRFGAPVGRWCGRAYMLATACMTAGGAALLHPAHILMAGALFHTGLVTFLVTAWFDRDGTAERLRGVIARRRSTR